MEQLLMTKNNLSTTGMTHLIQVLIHSLELKYRTLFSVSFNSVNFASVSLLTIRSWRNLTGLNLRSMLRRTTVWVLNLDHTDQ